MVAVLTLCPPDYGMPVAIGCSVGFTVSAVKGISLLLGVMSQGTLTQRILAAMGILTASLVIAASVWGISVPLRNL